MKYNDKVINMSSPEHSEESMQEGVDGSHSNEVTLLLREQTAAVNCVVLQSMPRNDAERIFQGSLRELRKEDIAAVVGIVRKNYSEKFAVAATSEMNDMFGTATMNPLYFVAEEEGEVVGVAGFKESTLEYGVYNIFWVNVTPERKGNGIGRLLVAKVIDTIQEKNPTMILLTTDIPEFYEQQFGFRTLSSTQPGYVLMGLNFDSQKST